MALVSDKLILTATTAPSRAFPDVNNWAETADALVDDVVGCYEAGAAIVHVHLPRDPAAAQEIVKQIRARCDMIIQAGRTGDPVEEREAEFKTDPDMIAVSATHHAQRFEGTSVNVLHPLDELEAYCQRCEDYQIKPDWEVWHAGAAWNLQWLVDHELASTPLTCTLFFNWPGGNWSPATPEEYLHRVHHLPAGTRHAVSVMGDQLATIATLAINTGGHVRVGTEDYPFIRPKTPARDNRQIVARVVRLAKELGRDLADPSEARALLEIPKK